MLHPSINVRSHKLHCMNCNSACMMIYSLIAIQRRQHSMDLPLNPVISWIETDSPPPEADKSGQLSGTR